MEQTAQDDHIGSKYDAYAQTATLKRAERYPFFHMVGELAGQRVLDLACGFGFYTKQLKQGGAVQVVGVDISPAMVRLAHATPARAQSPCVEGQQPGADTHERALCS